MSIKVLFVCMGNICRSPTAEGIFRQLVEDNNLPHQFEIDSAGTHAYHIGQAPDERAQQIAYRQGVDLSELTARKVCADYYQQFDYILVMDKANLDDIAPHCPTDLKYKIQRILDYAPQQSERDVPDPYYGGESGFEHVYNLLQQACEGLFSQVMAAKNIHA